VRLTHWVDAISIAVLVITGLLIARPQLSPLGEAYKNFWMGRIRELHFIFAYALTVGVLLRVSWFFRGNRYARSGAPLIWRAQWWRTVWQEFVEYLRSERGPMRLGHAPLAGAAYTAVILMALFQVLTGFAIYGQVNPGGFWDQLTGWVIPVFGGLFQTHMWHHLVAWGFVIYVIVHLYLVFYNSRLHKNGFVDSIVSGYKFYREGGRGGDKGIS